MYRIIGADGREYGPISADQVRQWIAENRANASTRILAEGSTEWKTLGSLPEFSQHFGAAAAQPSTPAAFPVSTGQVPKNNGFAIAGLVLGIIAVTFGLCCCYGMPFNLLGLVFSVIALVQINGNPQSYTGKGIAITGIVLSVVSLLISLILLIIFGASAGWNQMTHHAYRL